jgi:hypothetical protein
MDTAKVAAVKVLSLQPTFLQKLKDVVLNDNDC